MKLDTYTNILHGETYRDVPIPSPLPNAIVTLQGTKENIPAYFTLDNDILSKHSLIIGGTGCGKTKLFFHFVDQIKRHLTSEDIMIIFDSKGDFYSKFFSKEDAVVGSSKQYRTSSEKWNLFREVLMDGYDKKDYMVNIREICRAFFEERIQKNSSNSFFPNAACELLGAIIAAMIEECRPEDRKIIFRNEKLMRLLKQSSRQDLIDILTKYDDLKYVVSYIEKDNGQSQGVLSEMYSVVNELLVGVFSDNGGFSIRNFVREKKGRTLFVEYDLSAGSTFTPVYSLLFDLALKEALGRNKSNGNVYLICDEFRLLPNLNHIDDAVNFGRSLNVKVIAGLQSISQLTEAYGEARGLNIAAGFSSVYAFHANDSVTRNFVVELSGKNITVDEFQRNDGSYDDPQREGHTVEEWDMNSLKIGEAFVLLPFSSPFRFYFKEYK